MSTRLEFHKYQGLGNDFIVADLRDNAPSPSPEELRDGRFFVAQALCHRRLGIGADGIMSITAASSPGAVATMRVLNADGSEAEMCGNGLRCVARHLMERDPAKPLSVVIDTGAGALRCDATWEGDHVVSTTIDMGHARLANEEIPTAGPRGVHAMPKSYAVDGRSFEFRAVGMGNPHVITFVSETGDALVELAERVGPTMEVDNDFPERTNVEFACVHSPTSIELVVWERGVGITQACGTGACATAVAACLSGHSQPNTAIEVALPGGVLTIEPSLSYNRVLMSGPAEWVFSGEVDLAGF